MSKIHAKQSDNEATLSAKLAPLRMSIIGQTLMKMKSNAEQHQAQFLRGLLPSVEDADISRRRFAGIPELLSGMNIKFIDLSDTFTGMLDRQSIRMSRTDVHPNPRGHELLCDSFYAKFRANPDAWSKLVDPPTAITINPGLHNKARSCRRYPWCLYER